jgi:DnaJ-domain-containing protein 1
MAAVFAGFTVLLTVLAFAFRQPLVFVIAVPFGAATFFFWHHATGRLEARVRRRVRRERARASGRQQAGADPGRGGFGAGPREEWERPDGARFGPGGRFGPGPGPREARGRAKGQQQRAPGADPGSGTGPGDAEAYRVLGVDRDADQETVRRAYREKVKEVHPDTDSGSEEEFKRVKDAYERLTD